MHQSFIEYTSDSVKRVIQSSLVTQLFESGSKFLSQNKTQLLVTAGLITVLAFMSKPSEQKPIIKKDENDPNMQGSGTQAKKSIYRDQSAKQSPKSGVDIKVSSSKHHINDDLKKSWRQLNRRINRTMKKKGMVGGYKCDQTFDERSSDDGQIISPNFSIVSDVDQKFYADHVQNKLKPKRNYQTDNDSDNCLTFLNQKKNHMLKLAQEQKDGSDQLFFKLYAKVADLGIPEDEEDD